MSAPARNWTRAINPMSGYAKGNLGGIQGAGNEQLVAARALKHGFIAFFKLWSDTKYDMVIDCDGELFRTQIKGSQSGLIPFTTRQRGGVQKPKAKPVHFYTRQDCDLFIWVDSKSGDCYILPIDYVTATGKSSITAKSIPMFRERWDFIAGNKFLSVAECRKGIDPSTMRNRLSQFAPLLHPPTGTDALRRMFYENCP